MGTLRLRHCELLDALGKMFAEESESLGSSKNKCIQAFIRTCASVNYSPSSLPVLIENHLNLDETSTEENNPLNEIKNRVDLVWSLAILDQANQNHVSSVLTQDIFQLIQSKTLSEYYSSTVRLF